MKEETENNHMNLDKIVSTTLKHLAFLHYYPPESASTRSKFILALMLYIALQPFLAVYENWQHWNFNSRVSTVDNIIFSIGVLCLSTNAYWLSDKLRTHVNLTNSKYKLYSFGSGAENSGEKNDSVYLDRCTEGSRKALEGSSRALEGSSRALEGSSTLEGSSRVLEGSSRALEGSSRALEGSSRALEEGSKFELRGVNHINIGSSSGDFHHKNHSEAEIIASDEKSSETVGIIRGNLVESDNGEITFDRSSRATDDTGIMFRKYNSGSINSNNSKMRSIFNEEQIILGELTPEGFRSTKNVNITYMKGDYFLEKKQKLVEETTLDGCKRAKITANLIKYFFISYTVIPLSGFVSYFFHLKSIEHLPLPFLIYSPFSLTLNITSIFEYFLLTLVELFYIYYTTVLSTSVHVFQLFSINNLLGEMRLFHLNAQEIEGEFEKVLNGVLENEVSLRLAVRELVIHHQTIFRKVKELNYGSNFLIFYVNSYMCLQIVFGIFIFLKGELVDKIKYGTIVITCTFVQFIFSENGQRLQDEGEELRMALYECNWMGKPAWFTKVLQIMMIRNNNLPKVGLLNLFTLNRNNVTVVIRGVYSYFSILNSISS